MTAAVSTARYFPWDGGAIFIGTAGEIAAHAHQAIQICFRFEGCIRLRADRSDSWSDYEIALVPSRVTHAMDGGRVHFGATIFVEPETPEGRALAAHYGQRGISAVERQPFVGSLSRLCAAATEQRGRDAVVDAARGLVHGLAAQSRSMSASDDRILRAVRYVNANLSAPITLAQVAAVACLSPGRFRHLFAEQTGMGLRQYVLWRRFVSVWELRMNGASLSTAAHAAGFADSAHLTRTSRRMFGMPPSLMEIAAEE